MSKKQEAEGSSESALLKNLAILAQYRVQLVVGVFAASLLIAILVCVVPVTYTATTVILPPQSGSGIASALLGSLGSLGSGEGLGSLASLGEGGEFKNPADTFLGVLGSRSVADELIQRFQLQRVYKKRSLVDTRKSLAHHTEIELTRGSLIRITVEDHNVQRAVAIANGYVDALYRVNEHLALTTGAQKRLFLEQQLNAERGALAKAEDDFQEIQRKTGVIQLSGQAEITLRSIAQLRAALTAKEVQVELLRQTATEQNPAVQGLEGEIGAIREQLNKAESTSPGGDDSYFVSAGRIPTAGLEYLRSTRELRYHEALFEMLARQYEMARIEEAKSPNLIQVVDKAIAPDKKTWPPRTLLVLLTAFISAILFSGAILLKHRWADIATEPVNAAHVAALRKMFSREHLLDVHLPRAKPASES